MPSINVGPVPPADNISVMAGRTLVRAGNADRHGADEIVRSGKVVREHGVKPE